jgi:hypothetical protein
VSHIFDAGFRLITEEVRAVRNALGSLLTLGGGVMGCAVAWAAGGELAGPDAAAAVVGGGIIGLTLLALVVMVGRVIATVCRARSY